MNHQGTKPMETQRLILRRYTVDDAEEMFQNWANDEEVTKYLTWPPHGDVSVTRAYLTESVEAYASPDTYHWALVLKETGELIGDICAKTIEKIETAQFGWCIGRKWWGNGYVPEAAKAISDYLFDEVDFRRLEAIHDIDNPKSGRVMEKIGLKKEGVLRKRGRSNRGVIDEVWYGKVKEDR